VDGFGEILKLRSGFTAAAGRAAGFAKPTVLFGTALDQLKKIVDALGRFVDLGFKVDVDVSAGSGPTPSFIVALSMRLRLPEAPGTRVDIGMGKFRGEFDLRGRLQAAPNGITSAANSAWNSAATFSRRSSRRPCSPADSSGSSRASTTRANR
jgi:hypothetical protein